jgi:hypothetical protein
VRSLWKPRPFLVQASSRIRRPSVLTSSCRNRDAWTVGWCGHWITSENVTRNPTHRKRRDEWGTLAQVGQAAWDFRSRWQSGISPPIKTTLKSPHVVIAVLPELNSRRGGMRK